MDEIIAAPTTEALLLATYEVALPAVLQSADRLQQDAHPLADAPTVRLAKLLHFELSEAADFGRKAIDCLVSSEQRQNHATWLELLQRCLAHAGGLDGTDSIDHSSSPAAHYSVQPYRYQAEPKRDERFRDSYNAGVNPEAFLYDERASRLAIRRS